MNCRNLALTVLEAGSLGHFQFTAGDFLLCVSMVKGWELSGASFDEAVDPIHEGCTLVT